MPKKYTFLLKSFVSYVAIAPIGICFAVGCGDAGSGYWVHGNHVYYAFRDPSSQEEFRDDDIVVGADPATFKIINASKPERDEGPCEAQLVLNTFGKDRKHVFYLDAKIDSADPASIKLVGFEYVKDKRSVYLKNKKISNRPSHFHLVDGTQGFFATDGQSFFYRGKKMDARGFGFVPHSDDYTINKYHVFHRGEIVLGADPKSFSLFDTQDSSGKDANHVFYKDKVVYGADPETFHLVKSPGLYGDKNGLYMFGVEVPELREGDVRFSEFRNYLINSASVYKISTEEKNVRFLKLADADPNTFREIGSSWGKDSQHVYYKGNVVPGADSKSFEKTGENSGRDKYTDYLDGKPNEVRNPIGSPDRISSDPSH